MDLRYSIWFGVFALVVGLFSLAARVFRWRWAFKHSPEGRYWLRGHVMRYTVSPLAVAAGAIWVHLQQP